MGQDAGVCAAGTGMRIGILVAGKYAAAVLKCADTDDLIVGLRDNGGGGPESLALLVSYFVDQRTGLNDIGQRETNVSMQQWTADKVEGKPHGGRKPVVILAGPGAMSVGEDPNSRTCYAR